MRQIYIVRYWGIDTNMFHTSYCYFGSMKDAARWSMRQYREHKNFGEWNIEQLPKMSELLKKTF